MKKKLTLTICIVLSFFIFVNLVHSGENKLKTLKFKDNQYKLNPKFAPDIKHYSANCGDGDNFELKIIPENSDYEVEVNNKKLNIDKIKTYINSGLTYKDDIKISLRSNQNLNKKTNYYIHCVSKKFPKIKVKKKVGVDNGFLITNLRFHKAYELILLILDNNGVPRYRDIIVGRVTAFKKHIEGSYSYAIQKGITPYNMPQFEIIILDKHFNEQKRLTTKNLNHTDNHDFLITEDNTYLFLSYNSDFRDFSEIQKKFRKNQKNNLYYSHKQLTRDSVIQEQNDKGEVIFEWNSWDHVNIENCLNHRFPDDYAHINSIFLTEDKNILMSLRGCSQLIKIDRINKTGKKIFSIGGFDSEFKITNDKFKEFCAQHTATLLSETELYLFDNGNHCNGDREKKFGKFSRAVQYSLDFDNKEAKFVKDIKFKNPMGNFTTSGGSFFITKNGNWLINWSKGLYDITEHTPDGEEVLNISFQMNEKKLPVYQVDRIYEANFPIKINDEITFVNFKN